MAVWRKPTVSPRDVVGHSDDVDGRDSPAFRECLALKSCFAGCVERLPRAVRLHGEVRVDPSGRDRWAEAAYRFSSFNPADLSIGERGARAWASRCDNGVPQRPAMQRHFLDIEPSKPEGLKYASPHTARPRSGRRQVARSQLPAWAFPPNRVTTRRLIASR